MADEQGQTPTLQELLTLRDYIDRSVDLIGQRITREVAVRDQQINETARDLRHEVEREIGHVREQSHSLEVGIERRLFEINKIQEALNEHRNLFVTEAEHDRFNARITILESWRENLMGRIVGFGVVGAIFVGAVSAVITHLIQK